MKIRDFVNKGRVIIQLSKKAFGGYGLRILLLIILAVFGGILEGVSINALIPLFSFATHQSGPVDPLSVGLQKIFLWSNIPFTVSYLLVFIIGLFLLKTALTIMFSYVSVFVIAQYEEKTRSRLFEKVFQSKWSYLLKQRLGRVEQILLTDVGMAKNFLSIISASIMTLTNLVVYTVIAVNISWPITLFTFGVGILVLLVLKPLFKKIQVLAGQEEKLNKEVSHHVGQSIIGMKSIKAMNSGQTIALIGKHYFDAIKKMRLRSFFINIGTSNLLQPVSFIFICLLFAISYQLPNFNFVALITLIYVIRQIFTYVERVQTHMIGVYANYPYLKSILDFEEEMNLEREVKTVGESFSFERELRFEEVSFSYKEAPILNKINFVLQKGETIGIVGPSGAGKTTLVDLVLRLFSPTGGRIIVDGKNIEDINLSDWRESIGYVSQDVFLLNDTIENNIRFYNKDVTQEDIEQATKLANIYDFIINSEFGFQTEIGERGIMLSGGQKQRIVLARILARKPKVLLLDEATSALDNESEKKIQEVIEGLRGKVTVCIIAHRLSTVMHSDKLIVLKDGTIIEMGTPQQLINTKGSYFYKMNHLD